MERSISVLVGTENDKAVALGDKLSSRGASVRFVVHNALHIQNEVMRTKPDALIISERTSHAGTLCRLLKNCESSPYIILISGDPEEAGKRICADMVVDIGKGIDEQKLCEQFTSNFSSLKYHLRRSKADAMIHDALFELCVTQNYNGYRYIYRALSIAAELGCRPKLISKDIYPQIAAEYNTTAASVERNIRTVIHSAWAKAGAAVKLKYFGTFSQDKTWIPTNSQFIFIISDRLSCDPHFMSSAF